MTRDRHNPELLLRVGVLQAEQHNLAAAERSFLAVTRTRTEPETEPGRSGGSQFRHRTFGPSSAGNWRQGRQAVDSIPTDRQIRALHERYAPTQQAFDLVHTHCEIVCQVAEQLLARQDHAAEPLDTELVRAGSLLHDLGVYRLYSPSGVLDHKNFIRHGVLGHELLQDLGFPEELCRFCSCHTGMGLSRDDILRQSLPLPIGDYQATTGEELLVMYADKFHSKTTPPVFVTAASYAAGARRFGENQVARFAALTHRFGEPDLAPLVRTYQHALV